MNKIPEKQLFCLNCDLTSGKDGIPVTLQFEFVVGNLTKVPVCHSTLWRKMPFHMCSLSPIPLPEGNGAEVYFENGHSITINEPSIIFIPAGVTHRIDDFGSAPRESLWIHFRTQVMHNFDLFTHCGAKPFVSRDGYEEVRDLLFKIVQQPKVLNTANAAWLQLYGLNLTLKLLELAGIKPESVQEKISPALNRLQPALNLLCNAVRKPELAALAEAVHLSKSRFLTLFTQEIGIPPGKYFRQLQFERACRLLTDPNRTLAECAELLGFSDAFHFSREFHKLSGITPGSYRKQFR